MRAWAGEEEKRARLGSTGAFRIILLHREQENLFVAKMEWKFPYFSYSLLDYYSAHLHFTLVKNGGLCCFNLVWKIHFHKVFLSFSHFLKIPLYSWECIRKPDLPCLESTTLNFICIPQIPWLVGALIPWHITQLDPCKLVHPHFGHRCTVGVLLWTGWKGFSKHFHISLIRCFCAQKCSNVARSQSKSNSRVKSRQLKKELHKLHEQNVQLRGKWNLLCFFTVLISSFTNNTQFDWSLRVYWKTYTLVFIILV